MRVRIVGWLLILIGAGALSGGRAHGRDGDVTSRDIEQAFRTIRRAVVGGAEALPFGKAEILDVVKEAGGSDVAELQKDMTSYTLQNQKFVLVFYDDGDLQIRYNLEGGTWNTDAANKWNRSRRVGKAYLVDDGSITLEYTLLGSQGPSRAWLHGAMNEFHVASSGFADFLREAQKDGGK